jgi:hypothetical protein
MGLQQALLQRSTFLSVVFWDAGLPSAGKKTGCRGGAYYVRTVNKNTTPCTQLQAPAPVKTTPNAPTVLQQCITRQDTHWKEDRYDIYCLHLPPPCLYLRTTAAPRLRRRIDDHDLHLAQDVIHRSPLQLLRHLSEAQLLLWALVGPDSSPTRRGGLAGATTHHWDPCRASQPVPPRA